MTPPRKHLHFVQSIEPLQGGGLGRAAIDLHHAFRNHGVESQLVTTSGSRTSTGNDEGIREFPRMGPERAFYSAEIRSQAANLVGAADAVHAHGFYVATNWVLGREARKQGRPIVCHPHGFFEPWILQRSKMRKRLVHFLFEDKNFAAARLWRALTEKEAGQIRAQNISAPIVVAANGVDLNEFENDPSAPESASSAKIKRRMLFLARLHPKKGLDILIPAWDAARAAAKDWELVIAGPDELNHKAEVETWIRSRKLEDSVRFVGTVSGKEKVALIHSSDAFILPSHSEGFSVAILEAMACRVPVIATHACNFPELESEGGSWLCDSTSESVAMALERAFASSDEELTSRGNRARELVEKRYTWPIISETILDACQQHCQ